MSKVESLQAAVGAMKANRPLRAEEICRDYLESRPGCADHLRLLGHALMKQNRLAEAEKQLQFAVELKPGFPSVLFAVLLMTTPIQATTDIIKIIPNMVIFFCMIYNPDFFRRQAGDNKLKKPEL